MKRGFVILLAVFLNSQSAFTQEVDFRYFLYGTLSDYIGRQKCTKYEENVDSYYPYERDLMYYNYEHLKEQYPNLWIDTETLTLKSKELTTEINKLFDFDFDDGFCSDRHNEKGNPVDSSFVGKIKTDIFKTKKQKISYIIGAYIRHGVKDDKEYHINIANSVSTFPVCMKLLKELGCKNIRSKVIENIPYNYNIWFTPSAELKQYLSKYQFLRNIINAELEKRQKSKK